MALSYGWDGERLGADAELYDEAIAGASEADRTTAGLSQLVVSAHSVMTSMESDAASGAAPSEASSQIGLAYAEAIESVAAGSPAILWIGGRLRISTVGLKLGTSEQAASLEVSAFRVDADGGAWETAWTTVSLADGGLEVELPSGTYTRVRFTSGADTESAHLLKIALNAPTAEVHCVVIDDDGVAIYVGEIIYRGDFIKLDIDLLASAAGSQ